jgi:hypothetical protein
MGMEPAVGGAAAACDDHRVAPSPTKATFVLYGGTSTFSWYVPAFMWITEGRGGEEKRGGGITTERLRGAKSKVTKER